MNFYWKYTSRRAQHFEVVSGDISKRRYGWDIWHADIWRTRFMGDYKYFIMCVNDACYDYNDLKAVKFSTLKEAVAFFALIHDRSSP